jgi:hypothetical protein
MHPTIITIITDAMIGYHYITIGPYPWQYGTDVIIIKKMYMVMTYPLPFSTPPS